MAGIDQSTAREAVEAYARTGSLRKAAQLLGVGKDTIARRLQAAKDQGISAAPSKDMPAVEDRTTGDQRVLTGKGILTLEGLLEAAGIEPGDGWVVTKHMINSWDALGKDGKTVKLYQCKAWLDRAPSYFLQPVECQPIRRHPAKSRPQVRCALVVPDSQHGYRRHEDGTLEPLHDRAAVDVAVQVARLLAPQIDEIIFMGDMLDLSPFSRWSQEPGLRFTTQPALIEVHHMLAQFRLAAPSARLVYLEGNHELRIEKSLRDFAAGEVLNLRPADTIDAPPVMSIEYLLSLEALDVEYLKPYGACHWYEGVRFQHGHLARSKGGQTASAYLSNATSSMVWGHTHRLELAQRAISTPSGRKLVTAMSPGCLCRTDGAVPHGAGTQLDWQQGVGIVWYSESHGTTMQLVPIQQGAAVLNGRLIVGDPGVEDLRRATGYPF